MTKTVEWVARWSGGMKETAVLISSFAIVPQGDFARHVKHIPGGSEMYRADIEDDEIVLFLYRSGSGRTETACVVQGDQSWDDWDSAERDLGLDEGVLRSVFGW